MGFPGLTCIKCGVADMVALDLEDCKTFRCLECSESFTREELDAVLSSWAAVLAWVDGKPTVAGTPKTAWPDGSSGRVAFETTEGKVG